MAVNPFMQQFKKPSGWVGHFLVLPFLDRFHEELHAMLLEALVIQPQDQILEIGFGSGKVLTQVALKLGELGSISGLDYSPDIVEMALQKFNAEISTGKIKITQGDLARLPFKGEQFDKLYTANTIYYWPDPVVNLAEMARVIKPGGHCVIGFKHIKVVPGFSLNAKDYALYSLAQITEIISQFGSLKLLKIINKGSLICSACAICQKI